MNSSNVVQVLKTLLARENRINPPSCSLSCRLYEEILASCVKSRCAPRDLTSMGEFECEVKSEQLLPFTSYCPPALSKQHISIRISYFVITLFSTS